MTRWFGVKVVSLVLGSQAIACSGAIERVGLGDGGGTAGTPHAGGGSGNAGGIDGNAGGIDGNAGGGGSDATAGTGGGGMAGSTCPVPGGFGMSGSTIGRAGESYSGPAVVERSTIEDLVLYVEGTPGDATSVHRTTLRGTDRMPLFPVGTRVWLEQTPQGLPTGPGGFGPPRPYRFLVSDERDGTLLLGTAFGMDIPGIQITSTSERCTTPHSVCQNSTIVALNLTLQADESVEIPSDGQDTLHIDGVAYDISPSASREDIKGPCPPDYYSGSSMSLRVRARDAEARAKELPKVARPACSLANDLSASVDIALYGVSLGTSFEGTVVYTGLGQGRELLFATPGFTSDFGTPQLGVRASGFELTTPVLNSMLWATLPNYDAGALRESRGGPIVVAQAYSSRVPYDAATLSKLEHVLGLKVHAEKSCDYVAGDGGNKPDTALWDVVFETQPPVAAHAGARTPLTLDQHQYEVWVGGVGSGAFYLYRVD